ncbi:MAG: amidohydrolase [Deltaproteobacteria bacterium]|nr:amidohydrolase [Nannocystaceae bacterium]
MSLADPQLASEIEALHPELTRVRHDLHRHPELGFEEVRTSGIVKAWLEQHGYAPRACAKTGLVADLHASSRPGRSIALRADLDCLPMPETTDLPYRSQHDGRAHKCGHDGHTAVMMGVAALLARHRDSIPGNVRLLFQPAEEGVDGGGAKVMVAEGALDGIDEVYGLHNWPGYPHGHVRVRAGAMMAQTHTITIDLTGVGGHGSQPQLCRDVVLAGSQIVVALQTVVARGLGSDGGAVVSICRFDAGTTHNVLPGSAQLIGTVRTFSPMVTDRVLARIREVVEGTAMSTGVRAALTLDAGYPVLVNDASCAAAVERVATAQLGGDRVSGVDLPMAGGEDFAYMAAAVPGAYFFVGTGDREGAPVCHHPDFDFDDRIIPTAMSLFLGLVRDRLGA